MSITTPVPEIIARLSKSIDELEHSIIQATEALSLKFGENHSTTIRLNEYNKAIQNQRKQIEKLTEAIQNNNFEEISRGVSIINGLSHMIKEDAKGLVESMFSENTSVIDKDMLN